MMSFYAQLTGSREGAHFYRVILDGGDRLAFVVLDLPQGTIFPSTPEGRPTGDMHSSLDDGQTTMADEPNAEPSHLSREEFALISSSIRRQWQKDGEPPPRVTKYYG